MSCCVPMELDNIEAYEYTFPGLEKVDPLPEVVLKAPAEVKVTDGKIVVPAKADQLVNDVVAALLDENISQENLALIKTFSEISPGIPNNEIFETVTDNWIQGILDGTITPSANMISLANEFKSNPEFIKYLSQLELPTIDGIIPGGRLFFPLDVNNQFVDNEVLRSLESIGPCKKTAEKIYLENTNQLKTQADVQLAKSKVFYDAARKDATDIYNKRLVDKDKIIKDNVDVLNKFMRDFNRAVDLILYPPSVKRGLKIYIIAFVAELRRQIVSWGVAFTEAAKAARDKRTELATKEQAVADAQIKENLKVEVAKQTKAFEQAALSCHNQGAGG